MSQCPTIHHSPSLDGPVLWTSSSVVKGEIRLPACFSAPCLTAYVGRVHRIQPNTKTQTAAEVFVNFCGAIRAELRAHGHTHGGAALPTEPFCKTLVGFFFFWVKEGEKAGQKWEKHKQEYRLDTIRISLVSHVHVLIWAHIRRGWAAYNPSENLNVALVPLDLYI